MTSDFQAGIMEAENVRSLRAISPRNRLGAAGVPRREEAWGLSIARRPRLCATRVKTAIPMSDDTLESHWNEHQGCRCGQSFKGLGWDRNGQPAEEKSNSSRFMDHRLRYCTVACDWGQTRVRLCMSRAPDSRMARYDDVLASAVSSHTVPCVVSPSLVLVMNMTFDAAIVIAMTSFRQQQAGTWQLLRDGHLQAVRQVETTETPLHYHFVPPPGGTGASGSWNPNPSCRRLRWTDADTIISDEIRSPPLDDIFLDGLCFGR
ncbi:hypothetical protein CMUS01_06677 [Colletotrichum musicola]|uniref:Uncharacterized protein n=1 Tax=Colletotrichum musicola TaxID=2175873 RepID=A0A8H6KLV2_9PEZI|nr:hypothetical protein CMUS01_06677 [Colletotrichum musicola]